MTRMRWPSIKWPSKRFNMAQVSSRRATLFRPHRTWQVSIARSTREAGGGKEGDKVPCCGSLFAIGGGIHSGTARLHKILPWLMFGRGRLYENTLAAKRRPSNTIQKLYRLRPEEPSGHYYLAAPASRDANPSRLRPHSSLPESGTKPFLPG